MDFEFLMSSLYFVDQVHMEAERKTMMNQANVPADRQFQSRTTYRIRNKVTLLFWVYSRALCCSLSLVVDIFSVAANGFVLVSQFIILVLYLELLQPYRWPLKTKICIRTMLLILFKMSLDYYSLRSVILVVVVVQPRQELWNGGSILE